MYINVYAFKGFLRVFSIMYPFCFETTSFLRLIFSSDRFFRSFKCSTTLSSTVDGATFAWMLFRPNFYSLFFFNFHSFHHLPFEAVDILSILQIPPSENVEHPPILSG